MTPCLSTERPRIYKAQAQKRACRRGSKEQRLSREEEFIRAQQEEPEIQLWSSKEKPTYKTTISGVLCRRWRPKSQPSESCDQVVLPRMHREQALRLAHDIPMAGHLGRDRTLARLLK